MILNHRLMFPHLINLINLINRKLIAAKSMTGRRVSLTRPVDGIPMGGARIGKHYDKIPPLN